MKIYFALSGKTYLNILEGEKVENILVSYLGKNLIKEIKDNKNISLIVDSGAYTVWTKGKEIDIYSYINFCKDLEANNNLKALYFVNLDIIPGRYGYLPTSKEIEEASQKGWSNYLKMKEAGLNVMHIFHQHEDFKWLYRLLNTEGDYIGISPANDLSSKERLVWLKKVFNIVRDKKKTHGFGVTDIRILKEIPFYSADSSNWTMLVRWGISSLYNNFSAKTIRYRKLKDALKMNFDYNALDTPKILMGELYKHVDNILLMEKDLTKLWKIRKIQIAAK